MIEMQQPVRQIPAWVTLSVVLACMAGGGWLGYRLLWAGPADRIVVLDHNPDDGVRQGQGDNRWYVQAGNARLWVSAAKDGKTDMAFSFARMDLTREQNQAFNKCWRLIQDKAMAHAIGVTPLQSTRLEELRKAPKAEPTVDEMNRLRALWSAYQKASEGAAKNDAENKLVHELDSAAAPLEAPARQFRLDLIEKVKTILTPEQWKNYDDMK